ncbi:MAG TPA: hypothetical protein VGG85_06985 [Terracidiphilus sp.]|jgi:hypothetical protein
MNRGAGLLAVLAFVLTGIHLASGPTSRKQLTETVSGVPASMSRLPLLVDTSCKAFDMATSRSIPSKGDDKPPIRNGEIAAKIDRFLYGTEQSPLIPGALPKDIRLVIATVPDPIHTHLSLQFDRTLEALQQAAQDEKYNYDSSWLPWIMRSSEPSGAADKERQAQEDAQRENCPGVVLFRRNMNAQTLQDCKHGSGSTLSESEAPYHCGMLVFVVSETATSGLNRVQWDNAVGWMATYANKDRSDQALRVLGPTFSGSLPSFVRALQDTNKYPGLFDSTLLYSGRIRGCSSFSWLKKQFTPTSATGGVPSLVNIPVRIDDFEENEALQTDRFYRYLEDRGHHLSEIAILSEDETTYGALPDAGTHDSTTKDDSSRPLGCAPEYGMEDRPVHLYYPRDISAIRSAYQEQSIFSDGSKSDASTPSRTVLRPENSSSERADSDTIQPFSGTNMALTQEAQLYGIVNTLKTHGIRYVILRSTNSLDYLFLTRFLHRAYPTAYIVTMGSDLLFGREVDSTEFRGVIALSTFPLMPRGQDWTKQIVGVHQHAHRVFGSYTMEGTYIAARFIITDPKVTWQQLYNAAVSKKHLTHPSKSDIPDYASPFWDSPFGAGSEAEPATWLSVIGRDGYWPVAILKETLGNSPPQPSLAGVERIPQNQQEKLAEGLPIEKLSLSSSWRLCCVTALLAFAIHFFACHWGWRAQNLGMFVHFTPLEGRRSPALIAAGWSALCSLLLILFLASCRIFRWLGTMDRTWVIIMGCAAIAACVLATMEMKWWRDPISPEPKDLKERKAWASREVARGKLHFSPVWIVLMFAVIISFGYAAWLTFDYDGKDSSGVSTVYRSVHLTSGVSPILSLIVMLIGFYWWFWHTLSGLALLGNGRPVLPRRTDDDHPEQEIIPGGFSQISNVVAKSIEETAVPFPHVEKRTVLLYLVPTFVVGLLAFVLQRAYMPAFDLLLHSLENTAFNRTLHVLIGVGLYLILLECAQFFSTWLALKRLLLALNRLPLRRTFAALQGLSMRSLWTLSGTSSRARYKIFSHLLESLLHLKNELQAPESRGYGNEFLRDKVRNTWRAGRRFVEERSKLPDVAMFNDGEALDIRLQFCECSEQILNDLLIPEWLRERTSPFLREGPLEAKADEHMPLSNIVAVKMAEEFLCVVFVGYLQNLLGRMRTMVLSITGIFAAIAMAVGFYPFTPRPIISLSLVFLLLFIGSVVGMVYAGLDRDSTLSHITNTQPGSLGTQFWVRMISFIGVPAMGLIVGQFPEITDFVFSWITPTMNAAK